MGVSATTELGISMSMQLPQLHGITPPLAPPAVCWTMTTKCLFQMKVALCSLQHDVALSPVDALQPLCFRQKLTHALLCMPHTHVCVVR